MEKYSVTVWDFKEQQMNFRTKRYSPNPQLRISAIKVNLPEIAPFLRNYPVTAPLRRFDAGTEPDPKSPENNWVFIDPLRFHHKKSILNHSSI
jgi:hypothetical protein